MFRSKGVNHQGRWSTPFLYLQYVLLLMTTYTAYAQMGVIDYLPRLQGQKFKK